jgi:predicted Zn-dependent protease
VSRLLAKLNPESVPARNNFALLGLLSTGDKDSPRLLAATLYKEAPTDPEVLTTQGLSLTQQGKPEEAIALIATLKPDQASQPRTALYHGIFLAAAGRVDEAQPQLQAGAPSARFPDEKALIKILRLAFDATKNDRSGAQDAADAAWNRALSSAEGHPDWLEMLARIALKSGVARHADATLWKLAAEEHSPKWALESLWASTQKSGTPAQRYKVSKLLVKADPKDLSARNNSIILALLTNQEVDAPYRQAEALYKQNVGEPGIAATYGLSLYLQDRGDEALKLMDALPSKQLEEPRSALYYGVILAAAGQTKKAADYLRIGVSASIFPEERALVEKVATDLTLKAVLNERAGR